MNPYFTRGFYEELEKIALNRGAKDLVRLAIKEFPEIAGLSRIKEPIKMLAEIARGIHSGPEARLPSEELARLAQKYTKSPSPFLSTASTIHRNRRSALLTRTFGSDIDKGSDAIRKAVLGRHVAGKGEIAIPATFFEGLANPNRKRSPFVFRGNPFEEGQAFLTTRHPGSAAGYAMGDAIASHSRKKITNRLFALRRKGLKGIETIPDLYHGRGNSLDVYGGVSGPIDPINVFKESKELRRVISHDSNRTAEMVVNPKAKPQIVGEYTVRRSRIGSEPAYAIKPVGNSRLDIFKE